MVFPAKSHLKRQKQASLQQQLIHVSTLLLRVLIAKKVLKYAQSIEETQITRFWDIYTVPS